MSDAVAGYFRVSQARDGMHAPEIYRDEITRYCSYRNLTLAEVFSDIDFSGYRGSRPRPGLEELKDRRREFSSVVIPKLSRFGRSVKDLVDLFDLFDSDGIALIFLDMNIDTSTSQGRLLRHIMAAFAEYESDVKADYARANYRHAMQEGRTWGQPPFGYRADNKRYLVVDSEADIVRSIFQRYMHGATLHRITIELNAAGHVRRRGGLWRANKVGEILDNPAYAGLTSLDGELFTAQWEPIVDRATWDEVQRQRLPGSRGHRARKVGTGGPYLLSGLIVCGSCGAKAHHHRKTKYSAYQCMTQELLKKCDGGGVARHRADAIVADAVIERVRFTFGDAEFTDARDAWDRASLADKRRVLETVLDRVVIDPRPAGEPRNQPRRLTLEWKPRFSDGELIALPLEQEVAVSKRGVREGRPQSHRVDRDQRAKEARSAARRRYFEEWRAFRAARIIEPGARRDEGNVTLV
jgi:DNA invertase Pin-like site-specific DNA recombinase